MPGILKFLIVLAALTGASFSLAFAWQNAEAKYMAEALAASKAAKPPPLSAVAAPSSSEEAEPEAPARKPANLTSQGIKTAAEAAADAAGAEGEPKPAAEGDYAREAKPGSLAYSEPVDYAYFEDAIFFGDSISTGIPLYMKTTIPNVAVIAAQGVSPEGANTAAVIEVEDTRVTFLEAAKTKGERGKVYVMLGANALDLALEPFIEGYRDFIAALKAQYPAAQIYIQSMLPVTRGVGATYPNPNINNKRISEYNDAIRELALASNVHYVDVSQCMEDAEGYLPDNASPFDGMHLTPEYYIKWFDYLRSHAAIIKEE
jgi:lysophospholipase L1-like esterase